MLRVRGEKSRLPDCYEAGEAGQANWSGTALALAAVRVPQQKQGSQAGPLHSATIDSGSPSTRLAFPAEPTRLPRHAGFLSGLSPQ